MKLEQGGIRQQFRATALREFTADQKVAVAVHEAHRSTVAAEGAERLRNAGVERIGNIVIAGPVLEQIAEDVERLGLRGVRPRKSKNCWLMCGRSAQRCRSEMKMLCISDQG